MNLFIGHTTAAELLLYRGGKPFPKNCRSIDFSRAGIRAADAKALASTLPLPFPGTSRDGRIHLLVAESSQRRATDYLACHLWSGELPRGSFFKMDDGLYCSTPEFTIVQMARTLPFPREVELITNFCASYSLDPATGAITSNAPLTSVAKVASFLGRMPGAPGTRRAACALKFALEGSASPAESKLAIYNTLPPRWGGFGFYRPFLNYEIKLGKRARRMTTRNSLRIDEYFKNHRIGIEYQSREHHSTQRDYRADEQRRKVLESLGIRIIFVQPEELYASPSAYDDVARQVARSMGKRLRVLDGAHAQVHRQLYETLFGRESQH